MSCDVTSSETEVEKVLPKVEPGGFRALDFPEFSLREIRQFEQLFKQNAKDGKYMEFETLKAVLQKLGWAQTHVELKKLVQSLLQEVSASDGDRVDGNFRIELPANAIDLRTFMLLFKRIKSGELKDDAQANGIFANLQEIDVQEAGVGGAAVFFQKKVDVLNRGGTFEQEIRDMQEERRKQEAEKKERKAAFREKQAVFKSTETAK